MNEFEMQRRILAGEDSRTEFKSVVPGVAPEADEVAKALVALANSGGGELIFGVEDTGSISGVGGLPQSDALQRHIANVAGNVTPPLPVRALALMIDGKRIVVVTVPEFLPDRPFRGKSKYFVRDGPSSREARPQELKQLLSSAPIHYFDEQKIDTSHRDDLDDDVIAEFLRKAYPSARPEDTERYLMALQALDASGVPTVTGIVLFGRDPTRVLPGAYVSAVRFAGQHASAEFLDSTEARGNIFRRIGEAVDFLCRHVPSPSSTAGLARVSKGIPVEVWREAVTNAVTHQDHASPNQVRIFVYDDRVEIANPGELLNRLTVENIQLAGTKQPRNPHIASAVARYGLRENLGIGVPEIFRMIADAGLPAPQIRIEAGDFHLTVFTRT